MTEMGWDLGADEGASQRMEVPSLNKHALFYGGWTLGAGTVQARIYSRLIPEYLVAVAEMLSAIDVMGLKAGEAKAKVVRTFGAPDATILGSTHARTG